MQVAQLTPGDLFELVGVIIAIISLFGGFVIFKNRRYYEQFRSQMKQIQDHNIRLAGMVDSTMQAVVNIRNALQIQDGILQRLMTQAGLPKNQLTLFTSSAKEQNFLIDKCIQTLHIYVDEPEERAAAYQQLSEKFGDAETLLRLQEMVDQEKEKALDLRLAIKILTRRLNETGKHCS